MFLSGRSALVLIGVVPNAWLSSRNEFELGRFFPQSPKPNLTMNEAKLRWGILSTAEIAQKNWRAIFNSGNGVVAAVASRDAQRSRDFIALCQREAPFIQTPRALGSYEELIAAKDVDAVYLPVPTGLRKHWVIRA